MRSSTFAATAALLSSSLVFGQTFTECNPTLKSDCKTDPGLAGKLSIDFTQGESKDFKVADGTTLTYDGSNGAVFTIGKKTDAPTIGTNKYIMFGKVEVVMRASAGTGTVSSFILESDDLDEVDWEWLGSNDAQVQSNFFGKGNTTTYDRAIYHNLADPINSFHTYTIDWTAESLKWSIDGTQVRELLYADALALGGKNYPQTPMRVKMGNWIGCADAAAAADPKTKGTCDWAGGAIDLTKGPFNMYVKSVNIEDYGCGTTYKYGDQSGSWQSIESSPECDGSNAPKPSADSSPSESPKPVSPANSASQAAPAGASTTSSGAVLIETANSANVTAAQSTTPSASKPSADPTTLATAAGSTPSPEGASGSSTANQTSSGAPAQVSANSAPKTKYGPLDVAVMVIGLGLGYLVM